MQRGSVKKKLPVLLPFPPILFLNVGKKTLPFIIKRSDDNMPWPTQFKIMLELKRNQIIFQAIFLGMWPRKNTTPTTIANGLPKRPQRKKWYDVIWYNMIWYDMIRYDMIWYDLHIRMGVRKQQCNSTNAPLKDDKLAHGWASLQKQRPWLFFSILRCPSFNGYALTSYHHWEARLLSCVAVSSHPFRNQDRGFFFHVFFFFSFFEILIISSTGGHGGTDFDRHVEQRWPYYFLGKRLPHTRRHWLWLALRAGAAFLFLGQEPATHTAALTSAGA